MGTGAMGTFLGAVPLAFSASALFFTICIAFLGMVLLGSAHGLILLPILLSMFGPEDQKERITSTVDGGKMTTSSLNDHKEPTKIPIDISEEDDDDEGCPTLDSIPLSSCTRPVNDEATSMVGKDDDESIPLSSCTRPVNDEATSMVVKDDAESSTSFI